MATCHSNANLDQEECARERNWQLSIPLRNKVYHPERSSPNDFKSLCWSRNSTEAIGRRVAIEEQEFVDCFGIKLRYVRHAWRKS
jgi:hypothetical protein